MHQTHSQQLNASVLQIQHIHDDLMILRTTTDEFPKPTYLPGQYTVLGLPETAPRIDGLQSVDSTSRLLRRAYSFSCPILDEAGRLVTTAETAFDEFYIALVSRPSDDPPMLTPRLFALKEGDRLHLGPNPHGGYTLEFIQPHHDVLFFATGTGEAPHNAMTAELLSRGHEGTIISATCVRYFKDLAYLPTHRELQSRYHNYHYVPLTTREPQNLDASRDDFVGKQYLQDFVRSGQLEAIAGQAFDPGNTHVFLCGNPAMIGLPKRGVDGVAPFPEPIGMAQILTERGFRLDAPRAPGNIHFEKYW